MRTAQVQIALWLFLAGLGVFLVAAVAAAALGVRLPFAVSLVWVLLAAVPAAGLAWLYHGPLRRRTSDTETRRS